MRRKFGAADKFSPLYGRDAAIDLVHEFTARDDIGRELHDRRTPVLLFTGPRGIGKTALLSELRKALHDVPHAYLDCAGPAENPRDMLSMLAFDLNRQSGYGRLPFPRLITGEIVIGADLELDTTDREAARRQIGALLADHKKTRAVLEESVAAILKGTVQAVLTHNTGVTGSEVTDTADFASKYGTKLLLGGLAWSRPGRGLLLDKGQDWYRHQDRGLNHNPLDVLVDLRLKATRAQAGTAGPGDDRREAAELLWAAFLADLQHSFRSRRAVNWTLNCVVMLDNADTASGRAFLSELLTARRLRGEPDPLTVVATSRGGLNEWVRAVGLTSLADASRDHYLRRARTTPAKAWYPVALSSLSWTETRDMVEALGVPGLDGAPMTTAVHAFTGGHPGATRALLAALGERPEASAGLLAALAGPEPGILPGHERTAEDAMLHDMLRSLPPTAAEDLVTCAAARHQHAARRMAADSGLMEQFPGEELPMFAAEFWSDNPAGGPAVLQPLLRRLMLRQLAARGPGAQASWTAAHEWLRARSAEIGDKDAELYHALALADETHPAGVRQVAEELAGDLKVADEWLGRVARVTAAPNRLDHTREPRSQVRALTSWVSPCELPIAAVARLVASSWLGADPVSAPHWRQLLHDMASEIDQIARYGTDEGLTMLRDEAQRYRDTAGRSWSDVEDFWAARVAPSGQTTGRTVP